MPGRYLMASVNKVILIGNLGADPEIRNTPGGTVVANFRIACTETWRDNRGERQERTEWVTLVAWRKIAEVAQRYLRKGSQVYIEGKLQTRTWEDRQTGQKRYATEVLVDTLTMLGSRDRNAGGRQAEQQHEDPPPEGDPATVTDDDLPF